MNCVKLEDDHQYNFLTCMAMGGLNEKIFGIVDKHFPLIFPLLQSSLEELQSSLIQLGQDIHDGCQIFPAERSFAITVANAFLHLSSSHDVASMLNSQEMVLDLFKESIKCSYHVFQHGQDGQEHHHPEFGRTFKVIIFLKVTLENLKITLVNIKNYTCNSQNYSNLKTFPSSRRMRNSTHHR